MEYQWNFTSVLNTARIDCVRKTPVKIERFSDEQAATVFTAWRVQNLRTKKAYFNL